MSIIFGVLEEEYQRQKALKTLYEKQLKKLPKGSLRVRERGKRRYIYLLYRDGDRVFTAYVGEAGSPKVKALKEKLAERKRAQASLRRVKADLKLLERTTRARRKK